MYRLYAPEEAGPDGYPEAWHRTIKHDVREQAGHRCVRCKHPYRTGEHGKGEWTPCDTQCEHGMPARCINHPFTSLGAGTTTGGLLRDAADWSLGRVIEAKWRILTVHHLDGNKLNCRWWNLVALCQRCHLQIQGRVKIHQVYPWPHSEWFKPYAAGYYAWAYRGLELTREETMARMEVLLALELAGAQD